MMLRWESPESRFISMMYGRCQSPHVQVVYFRFVFVLYCEDDTEERTFICRRIAFEYFAPTANRGYSAAFNVKTT